MLKIPNPSSIEDIKIIMMNMGAIYRITTENIPFILNFPDISISSITVFGFKINPMNIAVASAIIGIIKLLVRKSKKVRISIPSGKNADQILNPKQDGSPSNRLSPSTIRQVIFLSICHLS